MMSEFDDKPINSPEEDKFGFRSLAETIADGILKMKEPEGAVIAINGPWGSGKSSLINLIRLHLCNKTEKSDLINIQIVDFKCWWFRGAEALTIAFFQELYFAMQPNTRKKGNDVIPKLVSQLLMVASPVVDSVVNLPGLSRTISEMMSLAEQDETVEKLHEKLSDALRNDPNHYLIIIDDIDRLSPDEAMLIFRLVKSVGGLPHTMYLLAYDRRLAEKIVTKRYPSEGPHYLEKIVQASFDLPEPSRFTLKSEYLAKINLILEEENPRGDTYFDNLFYDMIMPEIKTPRDLCRILTPLKFTWPAVKGKVDPAEFLCLETLRVQRPKLYAALRANKIRLTGSVMEDIGESEIMSIEAERAPEQYNKIFLKLEPPSEHERLRRGMMRLFPRLKRHWDNADHIDLPADRETRRRVCSPGHFDTYFRFSLSEHQVSKDEIKMLARNAGDFNFIRRSLLDAAEIRLTNGRTRASSLLFELATHSDHIPEHLIGDLLKAIYSIADTLIEKESGNMFEEPKEHLNMITRKLLLERLALETKPEVLRKACDQAALGYLAHITTTVYSQHFSTENAPSKLQEEWLTTKSHAAELRDLTVGRIKEAADDGSLIDVPCLNKILSYWENLEGDIEQVSSWASNIIIENDLAVARLAKAFTGVWSFGELGDSVSKQGHSVGTDALGRFVDLRTFRKRAEQVEKEGKLKDEDREDLKIFLDAWREQEKRSDNSL